MKETEKHIELSPFNIIPVDDDSDIINSLRESLQKAGYDLDYLSNPLDILEEKDPYTRGHSDRVSDYSVLIGIKMGLDQQTLETLKIGGLFHDIGKIGISNEILLKEGKLTVREYAQIKKHPRMGYKILEKNATFKHILPIVLHHHERYDGQGYPSKLAGEHIPLVARIVAVADTFDAMTSKRSYRKALPSDDVISEIKNNKGTQFDPEVADAFLDILNNDYNEIENIQKNYK